MKTPVTPACPACTVPLPSEPAIRGSDRLHGVPGRFDVHVCGSCGSGLTLPLVPDEGLSALYPEAYNAFALPGNPALRLAATGLFRWRYRRGLRRPPLAALRGQAPGRLLDVGGGRGDLGVVLARIGWHVTELEPSEAACAEARTRGVETVQGTLGTAAGHLQGGFDAAVFQHSLEHLAGPAEDLRTACRLVREGGMLLVTLPNFGSWQARRFGADWFHLDLPRHRTHFTATGLHALLERTGWQDIRTATSTSADGLPMSLQYRRFGERRFAAGAGRYAAAAASLAAVPLTVLADRAAGEGDILHAVARRPGKSSGRSAQ